MHPQPASRRPVDGAPGFFYVAWHRDGVITLRIGKRHVATADALERRAPRETLCGRPWRLSNEVRADDHWTTGDCQMCAKALASHLAEERSERP